MTINKPFMLTLFALFFMVACYSTGNHDRSMKKIDHYDGNAQSPNAARSEPGQTDITTQKMVWHIPQANLADYESYPQLYNGDFQYGLEGWHVGHGSNVSDYWDAQILPQDGDFTNVLDLWRKNSGNDGGTVWVEQRLQMPVAEYQTLHLQAKIKVMKHSLGSSGWWCDRYDCEGEYPARISVYYRAADGEIYVWSWGFLTRPNQAGLTNYDIVPANEWVRFTSHNLMGLQPRPVTIESISLAGAGWDYHSRFNDVQLQGK